LKYKFTHFISDDDSKISKFNKKKLEEASENC